MPSGIPNNHEAKRRKQLRWHHFGHQGRVKMAMAAMRSIIDGHYTTSAAKEEAQQIFFHLQNLYSLINERNDND